MPSIILQDLSCVTPDGDTLFAGLDLTFGPVRTGLVGRNGVGKSSLLKLVTGAIPPASGTITIDGTIGLLAQDFGSDPDLTLADIFAITEPLARLARVLDGRGSLDDTAEADWTLETRFAAALARVGLPEMAPTRRLDSLSGGQRTRVALAALLFGAPDFILLDEPTNNLDAEGRAAIAEILRAWRGGAIIVSHDRQLLREMDGIVELTTLGARAYGGNWDHFAERKAIERTAAEQTLAGAERRIGQIERKVQAVKEKKARSDSGGRRKRAKGDAPKILLDARRDNAERTGGAQSRLADRLRNEADAAAETARAAVEILDDVALRLSPTGLPAGRIVLDVDRLTGGPDPQNPVIRDVSLRITGPERVALTGPNGSGKTSLLRLLTGALSPVSGTMRIVAAHAMLDQHVSLLDPALSIRDNFRLQNPDDDENACRAALARFLFRADAALQPVGTLSGGERLRAGLAVTLGGGRPPDLLILDEPTNHLDLDAIAAVEAGLRAYDGALLVVSHDPDFLANIAVTRQFRLAP